MDNGALLEAILLDTESGDLKMCRHQSREFDLRTGQESVTFNDLVGCRMIYDMDAGKSYDVFRPEDIGVHVDVRGRHVRKAYLFNSVVALYVFSPRAWRSDFERDNWLRRAALLGSYEYPPPEEAGDTVHWVTLDDRLRPSMMRRAKASWFPMNPLVSFHTWTKLRGPEELESFMSEVSADDRELFLHRVVVHYLDELTQEVRAFSGDAVHLEAAFTDTSDLRAGIAKDIAAAVVLARKGGFYADMDRVFCVCPLSVLRSPTMTWLIPYDGSPTIKAANNYFMYYDGTSSQFPVVVRTVCNMWATLIEHLDHDYIPKAIQGLAGQVVDEILDVIVRAESPEDIVRISLGDLRGRLLAMLPSDALSELIVYGGEYFAIEDVLIRMVYDSMVSLGIEERYQELFSALHMSLRLKDIRAAYYLASILTALFERRRDVTEDFIKVSKHLANDAQLPGADVMRRASHVTNVGCHVRRMAKDESFSFLTNCLMDVDSRYIELKFDAVVLCCPDAGRSFL